MKRTSSMVYKPSVEATELKLFASNNYPIYAGMIKSVMANLEKKVKAGIYESEKAIDAWYAVMVQASKIYNKEFGYSFSVTDRFTAAVEMEAEAMEEING